MAKNSKNYDDIAKNSCIYEEYEKIISYFEDLSEGEAAVIYPLIKSAAFMSITLEDLANLISREGPVEEYKNGENQRGMKQSAALQSYNSTVKNYAAVIKTLYGLLPKSKRPASPVLLSRPRESSEKEKRERDRSAEISSKTARLTILLCESETEEEMVFYEEQRAKFNELFDNDEEIPEIVLYEDMHNV